MEWTRDKTLALINEYRKRRGLWDMTHDDYRKKEVKQKLLVAVSSSLGGNIPIVEIEKKFHTLRTQYHREINRMKRKEPYNSKWFGFKNLQFLSSPKACRSNKGRIKSEITEEGTVTTKYILREAVPQHDSSGGSVNSNSDLNDEFLTIHRKPTISYETVSGNNSTVAATSTRSQELEKLIEETTKDVEEIEEAKPNMTIKTITVPLEHHTQYGAHANGGAAEISTGEHQNQQQQHQHHHHEHHQQQQITEVEDQLEAIEMQNAAEEIAYQTSTSNAVAHTQNATTLHSHAIPTRIIKIQRRDTCHDDEFYEDDQQHQQQQQPQQLHAIPTGTTKRIYYDAIGQAHTATILTTTTTAPQSNANSTMLTPAKLQQHHQQQQQPLITRNVSPTGTSPQARDEFATYGEYVANEMRGITNREILVALKHKINTALFEASMAELQK